MPISQVARTSLSAYHPGLASPFVSVLSYPKAVSPTLIDTRERGLAKGLAASLNTLNWISSPTTYQASRQPAHAATRERYLPSPRSIVTMAATQAGAISKKRKFVADGVFYAELNEFFQRELAEEGYSGVEVRVTPTVTDISKMKFYGSISGIADMK